VPGRSSATLGDGLDALSQGDLDWLHGLRASERARFLARLAHNLTISGRAVFLLPSPAETRLEQLRQLNEIQHRVTSYIGHALSTDEDLRWLPIVAKIVLEPPDADLRTATTWAWAQTRESFVAVP
jgi:hypothetical protein